MWSGPKENTLRRRDPCLDHLAPDGEVVLEQAALDHGDRARRDVVVVEAGVVLGRPAQQPDVDVGVTVQRDVDAVVVAEREVVPPQPGLRREASRQAAQLLLVEVPPGQARERQRRRGRREVLGLSGGHGGVLGHELGGGDGRGHATASHASSIPSTRRGLSTRIRRAAAAPSASTEADAYGASVPSTIVSMPSTRTRLSSPVAP